MNSFEYHDKGWNLSADILDIKLLMKQYPTDKKLQNYLTEALKKKKEELEKLKKKSPKSDTVPRNK